MWLELLNLNVFLGFAIGDSSISELLKFRCGKYILLSAGRFLLSTIMPDYTVKVYKKYTVLYGKNSGSKKMRNIDPPYIGVR